MKLNIFVALIFYFSSLILAVPLPQGRLREFFRYIGMTETSNSRPAFESIHYRGQWLEPENAEVESPRFAPGRQPFERTPATPSGPGSSPPHGLNHEDSKRLVTHHAVVTGPDGEVMLGAFKAPNKNKAPPSIPPAPRMGFQSPPHFP